MPSVFPSSSSSTLQVSQNPFQTKKKSVSFSETQRAVLEPTQGVEKTSEDFWQLSPEDLSQKTQVPPNPASPKEVLTTHEDETKNKKEKKEKQDTPLQALPPNSKKEGQFRVLGRYALAVANAGIFTQNMVAVMRAPVLDAVPQPFNVLGSLVNLVSCFVPPVARLPMFVAGTSLYMGGSALTQSHMDQVNVSQASKTEKTFYQIVEGSKWNSFAEFPHPAYSQPISEKAKAFYRESQGKKIMPNATVKDYKGFMHMAHPGSMASLARNKYYETYFPLLEKFSPAFDRLPLPSSIKYVLPSSFASGIAGAKQLGWMVGKMAMDWRFAHDALMLTTRREFLKGTEITMPNASSYVLAIGSVLPILMLSAAMLVEGGKQAYQHTHKKDDAAKAKLMTANESVDQPASAKTEDPFAKTHANTVELVANASSVIPQLANLMFLPIIWKEGNGNPLHIHPAGLKLDHAITPRLNAALVGTGSVGALLSALTAVSSDLSLAPRYVAYLADIAFMAFSGITSAGLARNTFENVFRNTQSTHWYTTPNALKHAADLAEARQKGWLKYYPKSRIPQNTALEALLKEAKDPKKP